MVTLGELIKEQEARIEGAARLSNRASRTLNAISYAQHFAQIAEYYRDAERRKARAHKQAERRALCLA